MNTITIVFLHVIAGLSSLPMVFSAGLRMRKASSPFAMAILVICVLAAMAECFYLSFCTSSFSLPYMVDDMIGRIDVALVNNGLICSLIVFINVALLAMTMFLKRGNMKRFAIILLCLFLSCLLTIAVLGSFATERSLDECFFGACCGVMYVVGSLLGFTYKEICVIGNIYMEAVVCLLSGLWVAWTAIRRYIANKNAVNLVLMAASIIYGGIYIACFAWVCQHYAMPMDAAFDLCYRELVMLAKEYHTTYNNVNYVIFILLFLACLLGNWVVVRLIHVNNNKNRHSLLTVTASGVICNNKYET